MANVLLINAAGGETRVALVENGSITEYYLDRKRDRGIVGNIYKGRVVRVLPGMQAAFVDIGLDKAAFLYVSDVFYDPDFSEQEFDLTEGEHAEHEDIPAPEQLEEAEARAQAEKAHEAIPPPPPADAMVEAAPAPQPGEAADSAAPSPGTGSGSHELVEPPPSPPPQSGEGATSLEASSSADGPETAENDDEFEDDPDQPAEEPLAAGAAPPAPTGEPTPPVAGSMAAPRPPQAAREVGREGGGGRRRRRRRRGAGAGEANRPNGQAPAPAQRADSHREEKDHRRNGERGAGVQIQDLLKEGQEVIVQVVKDPIGTKGARVTSHISLPGRHLVFMPTVDHVGISRRIDNEKERKRLREIINRMRPPGTGFIVRTVAEGVSEDKLVADIRFLINEWNEVGKSKDHKGAPVLLHPDLEMVLRATRDLFTNDVSKLIIDDRDEYERVLAFVETLDPALKAQVELYTGEDPIFDAYGVEQEIRRALNRKVWLKSGGSLIIDQAEALVAIDVNSGRYVGKKNLEETITRINTEAAKEIVYQLRLRNIGGIIIIDFIDMDKPQNREKVFKALQEALGRDRAKTNVLKISELGLVEMTRKRVRESLGRMLNEACPYCDGKGYIRSKVTVVYEIFREIRREAPNFSEQTLVVNCHPEVAKILLNEERTELRYLMDRYNKSIQVKPQPNYHQEQYELYGRQAQKQGAAQPSEA
jgi:ribonuclease G